MKPNLGAQARHRIVLSALKAAGRHRPTLESLFPRTLQLPPYADNPTEDGLPPVLDPERAP